MALVTAVELVVSAMIKFALFSMGPGLRLCMGRNVAFGNRSGVSVERIAPKVPALRCSMDGVFTKSAAMSSVCSSHCSLNSWNLLAGGAPAASQISALQGCLCVRTSVQ